MKGLCLVSNVTVRLFVYFVVLGVVRSTGTYY